MSAHPPRLHNHPFLELVMLLQLLCAHRGYSEWNVNRRRGKFGLVYVRRCFFFTFILMQTAVGSRAGQRGRVYTYPDRWSDFSSSNLMLRFHQCALCWSKIMPKKDIRPIVTPNHWRQSELLHVVCMSMKIDMRKEVPEPTFDSPCITNPRSCDVATVYCADLYSKPTAVPSPSGVQPREPLTQRSMEQGLSVP